MDLQISGTPIYNAASATVVMRMKPSGATAPIPSRNTAATATFTVSYVAAAGNVPAYWRGTLDAETSRNLTAGAYVVDAAISVGGSVVQVVDAIRIIINESVSPL